MANCKRNKDDVEARTEDKEGCEKMLKACSQTVIQITKGMVVKNSCVQMKLLQRGKKE